MWMKWWNLDRLFVWTNLNSLNRLNRFLNRLNRFLNRFYVWIVWTDFFFKFFYLIFYFFMKVLWNLNRFCCYVLNKLNIFYVWMVEQIFLWSFCEIWTDFVAVFWTNWIDFKCEHVEQIFYKVSVKFEQILLLFFEQILCVNKLNRFFYYKKTNKIFNILNQPNQLNRLQKIASL